MSESAVGSGKEPVFYRAALDAVDEASHWALMAIYIGEAQRACIAENRTTAQG